MTVTDLDNQNPCYQSSQKLGIIVSKLIVILRRHSDSTSRTGGVDAPYYRDFIAKRPVVIKNILQTTASVDTRAKWSGHNYAWSNW
jgi:hypothetical protein